MNEKFDCKLYFHQLEMAFFSENYISTAAACPPLNDTSVASIVIMVSSFAHHSSGILTRPSIQTIPLQEPVCPTVSMCTMMMMYSTLEFTAKQL
jgi:hypothetical protein